jgi:hypothetical protein
VARDKGRAAWIFQVGRDLIANHNDIFNFRTALLILAMIQISGAAVSLAEDFERNFEEEYPPS